MKKLLTLLLLPLLFGLSGCGQAARLSDAEIAAIVDAALTRGEIANSFYIGDLPNYYDHDTADYKYVGRVEWDKHAYTLLPNNDKLPELQAVCESIASPDDVATVFRDAFVPELAARYIADIDGIYAVEDGVLYIYLTVHNPPLSLIHWQHEPLRVISQSADKIEVELAGKYMLTGTETTLPLTLTNVGGQWLLDDSFSPREYTEDDFAHSRDEVYAIITDVAARVRIADLVWQFDFDVDREATYERYRNYYYNQIFLIDREHQYNEEYARLAKELRTLDDVKRCFYAAFTPEFAQHCIDVHFHFDSDYPCYVELPDGLAVNYGLTAMPMLMCKWQLDDFIVWRDTEEEIVFLAYMEGLYSGDGYFALRLQNIDGRWYCDETIDNIGSSVYSWELTVPAWRPWLTDEPDEPDEPA